MAVLDPLDIVIDILQLDVAINISGANFQTKTFEPCIVMRKSSQQRVIHGGVCTKLRSLTR